MKIIYIKSFLLFTILTMNFSLSALRYSTVNACTALVAFGCASCSYTLAREMAMSRHAYGLASISALITGATYYALYQLTPSGRCKKANILLKEIARYPFANTYFNNEQEFFDAIEDVYLTCDLPLIKAYNDLVQIVAKIACALDLINKSLDQTGSNKTLKKKCKKLLCEGNRLFKNIGRAIKFIRGHKDYLAQLSIYKDSLLRQQEIIAQQQMAHAHQEAVALKQSSFLLKVLRFFFKK